jgi:hypothetical protein
MKKARKNCIDCGSEAVDTLIDEVKPVYKLEITNFSCGAELRNIFSSNGNVGRVEHSGCKQEEASASDYN